MLTSTMTKQLLDNQASSVILLDSSLSIQYMNSSAEMLLAATLRRMQSASITDWIALNPAELDAMQATLESGHAYTRREAEIISSAGDTLTVDYSVSCIHEHGQPFLLVELQARDRLRRIEQEKEMLMRHETTRNLVRGMAHEIKNPLGGIRGAAQLLEAELDDPELHEYTQVIIEEADRLRNLVDRLLGSHKIAQRQPLNVHSVLERVCTIVKAEVTGQVIIERDYDPSIPELLGDNEQLIQAVLNVVRNAVQAMLENDIPAPVLKLRTRTRRQVTLSAESHRLVCCIEIIDNGPGIPEEMVKNIFFPMISGRAEGTGLGLSIAQSIISQHHGLIECHSEPGHTCFTLLIPLERNDEN
ncbi:nitrogen regulation protein NR(II) [Neptunomonas marina]|uniref:histidine kinase n=1 Tax=Neptunomonas marina TaxID=1815562 RepID=A0A437Q3U1_9GAMM|nr:nitrogen regulation protein NR(II) [Neptunomonas marina]RVU29199.1 nitrogen regulation protein NR(II) [Neptunomonas marina]